MRSDQHAVFRRFSRIARRRNETRKKAFSKVSPKIRRTRSVHCRKNRVNLNPRDRAMHFLPRPPNRAAPSAKLCLRISRTQRGLARKIRSANYRATPPRSHHRWIPNRLSRSFLMAVNSIPTQTESLASHLFQASRASFHRLKSKYLTLSPECLGTITDRLWQIRLWQIRLWQIPF